MSAADDDWAPNFADVELDLRWKWGWRADTDEVTVWDVGGPGDGFPTHDAYLQVAWGREPRFAKGDLVGVADRVADAVHVRSYYSRLVPDAVIAAFRTLLPAETRIERVEPSSDKED